MKRLALTAAIATLLAGAVLAYGEIGSHSSTRDAAKASKLIHLRGQVKGFYPGARKVMRVRITNGTRRTLVLRRMHTRVHAAGSGCNRLNLELGGLKRARKIPPHRQRRVAVRVAMPRSSTDACQGAEFPLNFHARFARGR
jgi:dienelactone hydrolase